MSWRENSRQEVQAGLQQHYARLWRYCLVLTGNRDEANDLAQAACLHAIEKSDLYQAGTHVDRWFFRLTQRLWFNERRKVALRQRGGIVNLDDTEIVDPNPGPEMNTIARQVLKAVMALPEAQRLTVLLVYVEGYSYHEAAEVLEVPIGTVMSRLFAARSKLAGQNERERKSG